MDLEIETIKPQKILGGIKSITKTETEYMIRYKTGELAKLNILNNHVFKYFMSPTGVFPDYPEPHNAKDTAKINLKKVSDYDKKAFEQSSVKEHEKSFIIHLHKIQIEFHKSKGTMTVVDNRTNKRTLNEAKPLSYADLKSTQTLHQHKNEYFFGGGMQNGRFSHKGEMIDIVNTNQWTDRGVTSPCPFYWSSRGYGVLRNTWQPGKYDFGLQSPEIVTTIHKGEDFDAFFFINSQPTNILSDYYELTGRPIFMPEYAFYEAHLNAFNRDYWVKVNINEPGAILFEDGNYYKSYKPNEIGDKKGILESLNGEKNNYQFSARAMIDRYKRHDMPLGWFVPNDGYGSGYGQTDSLDGDIQNLKEFANYARENGVEVALWTESQLEPENPQKPKKGERDLNKEVSVAGVVALKCDVAWIGCGYSFGLNAVENAADIFVRATKYGCRTMIIMVDGWAGTQRHSGIWSGDQTGGEWEYIRFHIPTYIGTGLSGQPVVGSDMDGIYGGGNREVNIRDYQWKTFTPLQLNMDGWGKLPKTPFSFDCICKTPGILANAQLIHSCCSNSEATGINRAYLKLKSMLMPYNYTIGFESTQGLPMIRAMFLEFPEENLAYTKDSQYQFMWGPSILVAPVYNKEKNEGSISDWIRNEIYLPNPNQVWIDFFTGEKYQGGKILNCVDTPLWKIPVYVRDGAIIPMVNPNNNPNQIQRENRIFNLYPNGETVFNMHEDDGKSSDYLEGHCAKTKIAVIGPASNENGELYIFIDKTRGDYKNMIKERTTLLRIMASRNIMHIKAAINGKFVKLSNAKTEEDFETNENVYYLKENFIVNPYLTDLGGNVLNQKFLLIKIEKLDITIKEITIKIKDFINKGKVFGLNTVNDSLSVPRFTIPDKEVTSNSITVQWEPVEANYYEIERDGAIFSNIIGTTFNFKGFKYDTTHSFRIRSASDDNVSKWSDYMTTTTKGDPCKYTVKNVRVTCNIPCQPCQEISKFTDGNPKSLWHTNWAKPGQANTKSGSVILLSFDLGDAYELQKMEYIPRDDAGNGTILMLRYRHSIDGKSWSQLSDKITWNCDEIVKEVNLNGTKLRFMELSVLKTVGGFGSGRQMMFYRKVD